jgi:hypothetical protein
MKSPGEEIAGVLRVFGYVLGEDGEELQEPKAAPWAEKDRPDGPSKLRLHGFTAFGLKARASSAQSIGLD